MSWGTLDWNKNVSFAQRLRLNEHMGLIHGHRSQSHESDTNEFTKIALSFPHLSTLCSRMKEFRICLKPHVLFKTGSRLLRNPEASIWIRADECLLLQQRWPPVSVLDPLSWTSWTPERCGCWATLCRDTDSCRGWHPKKKNKNNKRKTLK